ncbi:cytochrome c [Methylobrevis pamukkalensis]|uniref:Cytochrome c-556 n=1 Tax=Methylobrevis pamukkalensis TaxID=1439726 RepID=A0A1E3H0A2_9HYPH|nr:cytochrome c [Methylobrevis pamukkalensis]ODN69720.1 Cytochrome c-556 [Methylobrevis pamukkalensis]
MKHTVLAALCAGLLATVAASAQGNPVEEREKLMKAISTEMKAAGGMVQGKTAYDPAAAAAAATSVSGKAAMIPDLFAPGTEGGDALPAVWEKKAEFDAIAKKLADAAGAAATAAPQGLDAFKAPSAPWPRPARAATKPIARRTTDPPGPGFAAGWTRPELHARTRAARPEKTRVPASQFAPASFVVPTRRFTNRSLRDRLGGLRHVRGDRSGAVSGSVGCGRLEALPGAFGASAGGGTGGLAKAEAACGRPKRNVVSDCD